MYYVYIIRCQDNSLYTGITNNINKRIQEHYYKKGNSAKYTRARTIINIELIWLVETRSEACKLEYYIKSLTKQLKEQMIINPKQFDNLNYEFTKNITLENCLQNK